MKVKITKLTTAPKEKCPECGSKDAIWCEVEGLGIGFYQCRVCGCEGW